MLYARGQNKTRVPHDISHNSDMVARIIISIKLHEAFQSAESVCSDNVFHIKISKI